MEWKILNSKVVNGLTTEKFLTAVSIWIEKPHVVNRHLCGAQILSRSQLNSLVKISDRTFYNKLKQCIEENLDNLEDAFKDLLLVDSEEVEFIIRDVLPKDSARYRTMREVITVDRANGAVTFFPVSNIRDSSGDVYNQCYRISCVNSDGQCSIELSVDVGENVVAHIQHTETWLNDTLFPKLVKWMSQGDLKNTVSSLQLVPLERYNALYQEMKVKYGKDLVETWNERTDPQKFVYEELAIASYLMVLFEEEFQKSGKKQTFVDLGCGNGLLVYVLANEGYHGIGVDVRKRKIWDTYGTNVVLKEETITPSASHLFTDYDWIIGNHSDELTPWIPVISARSSFSCKYFVLPCCPHDFNCKFRDKPGRTSVYQGYLNYVQDIGEKCGFSVEKDTLRIPSTKRICFVGRKRIYSQMEEDSIDKTLQKFIDERCSVNNRRNSLDQCNPVLNGGHHNKKFKHDNIGEASGDWVSNFSPRPSVEKIRNCSTVDSTLQKTIVDKVFNSLLEKDDICELSDGRKWNKGGAIDIGEVVKMFDKDSLKQLKNECGGIQTLLRNHHQIFLVTGGKVQLRGDQTLTRHKNKNRDKSTKSGKFPKTLMCWFHLNHPNGCPYSASDCKYAHSEQELIHNLSNCSSESHGELSTSIGASSS